jgi:hypothetical protein
MTVNDLSFTGSLPGEAPDCVEARHIACDVPVTADPSAAHWREVQPIIAANDRYGQPVPGHRTEIRTLWSDRFLYVLYTCPYEKLHLTQNPNRMDETDRLWEYDVAELFIGSDDDINLYKEFEISPQGEWVDLDIDHEHPEKQRGRYWDSGFELKSRLDRSARTWHGEMKIPLQSITAKAVTPGMEMRANFYRCQGPPPERIYLAWRPVNNPSFHTPEAFGWIRFAS